MPTIPWLAHKESHWRKEISVFNHVWEGQDRRVLIHFKVPRKMKKGNRVFAKLEFQSGFTIFSMRICHFLMTNLWIYSFG